MSSPNKNNENTGFLSRLVVPEDEVKKALEKYKRCVKKLENGNKRNCKAEKEELYYAQLRMYSFSILR